MVLFFRAVRQQALDRTYDDIPDLESYIALRRDTSGCKPCFALIEFAGGYDLPDVVVEHPSIQILQDATNDLVTWSNVSNPMPSYTRHPLQVCKSRSIADPLRVQDIFSYNVEQSRGDTHNMVVVLMHEQGLAVQEAIDAVADLCERSIDTFEQTRRSLPSWGPIVDSNVESYIDGLQNWIIGSLHWSFLTERSVPPWRRWLRDRS